MFSLGNKSVSVPIFVQPRTVCYQGITAHLEAGMQLDTIRSTEVVVSSSVPGSVDVNCNTSVKAWNVLLGVWSSCVMHSTSHLIPYLLVWQIN